MERKKKKKNYRVNNLSVWHTTDICVLLIHSTHTHTALILLHFLIQLCARGTLTTKKKKKKLKKYIHK